MRSDEAPMPMSLAICGVTLTVLKRIPTPGGDVLGAMKHTDTGFAGFGEAYFSIVKPGAVKAWKYHKRMTLNLVVPVGTVRFVIRDDRASSPSNGLIEQVTLSPSNYQRLTIPPMIWFGFQGIGAIDAMLLNLANIAHDPLEADRQPPDAFSFDWNATQ